MPNQNTPQKDRIRPIRGHYLFGFAILLCVFSVLPWGNRASVQADANTPKVVISGVYFDGHLRGDPEPEEAVRLTNTSLTQTADVSHWVLSDRYLILSKRGRKKKSKRWKRKKRKNFSNLRNNITLPSNLKIPPGGSIWIAHKGKAFKRVFGFAPHAEMVDTLGNIPKVSKSKGWLLLFASRGILSLHNPQGNVQDVICYVRSTEHDSLNHALLPQGSWRGSSVLLRWANTYSWTGQILARDRDKNGLPTTDTNTAKDWNSSFSRAKLGVDPIHRVELPGQTLFNPKNHKGVYAEVLATSAPENNFAALTKAFKRAKREILINIYQFTNVLIADALLYALKKGVKVKLLIEGVPVGGLRDKSRYIATRLVKAGAKIYWMRGNRRKRIRRRYRFNHAKYVLIDRKWVIIGTENYGSTGHPVHPTYGNRGWEIHVRSPKLFRDLYKVFRADTAAARHLDLLPHQSSRSRWGSPKKSNFRPKRKFRKGRYLYKKSPKRIKGTMDLQLILSPDNSLHEKGSIIGSILACKKEVLIQQNSIQLYWGKKNRRSFSSTPSLPLMAVIKAARKGCRVRVLLDSTWYNIRSDNPRGNDKTVWKLNKIAKDENLNLQAKLINLQAANIVKIHAKGVIVDRKVIFVGSINWSENSFKGNREVGVLIKHPKVAMYYTDLFMRDWLHSRIFRVVINKKRVPVYAKPNALAKVIGIRYAGDPLDVLAEVGEFYQVRLPYRRIAFLRKEQHTILVNPFEARFQVGKRATLAGKIHSIRSYRKLHKMYFAKSFKQGFEIIIWRKTAEKLKNKYGSLKRALVGRYVQIQGKISTYRGKPQIILRSPSHLTVLY